MFLLLIAVDFGRVFFTTIQLSNAVREAAVYGATQPTDPAGMLVRANRERNAQYQTGQQSTLTNANIAVLCQTPADVTIPCDQSPGGAGAGNTVTVTLTAPFTFFTPLINGFFGNNLNVSSAATVAVLNTAAGGGDNPDGCNPPTVSNLTVFISNLTVTLDPSGSLPESGICAIAGYNYDFGDGAFGSGGTVPTTYTYASPGTYAIVLEVTNQGGSLNSTAHTVTVPPAGPTPSPTSAPSATASAPPTPAPSVCTVPVANFAGVSGNPGKSFTFTDKSTTPAGCPITTWLWNFGDGNPTTNAQNPAHTFPLNNTYYMVTLTVTNAGGSKAITIQVHT